VILVLLAIAMRPRFARLPKDAMLLQPDEAPALYALVARVAQAAGAPPPDRIALDDEFNASAAMYGLRRRRYLSIGLPLWQALQPQQRVAVLGHEMGHFVNGDPRRSIFVGPVDSGLGALVSALTPARMVISTNLSWLVNLLLAVPRWLVAGVRTALVALAQREGQRAEYRADALGARVAGRGAMVDKLDLFVLGDVVQMLLRREARAGVAPSAWSATTAAALAEARPQRAVRRQLDVRTSVSLFAGHPPSGLRARLVENRPAEPPAVELDEATAAAIEGELAKHVARTARTLKSL
jgi:Zn-dependent protease with chaperone function